MASLFIRQKLEPLVIVLCFGSWVKWPLHTLWSSPFITTPHPTPPHFLHCRQYKYFILFPFVMYSLPSWLLQVLFLPSDILPPHRFLLPSYPPSLLSNLYWIKSIHLPWLYFIFYYYSTYHVLLWFLFTCLHSQLDYTLHEYKCCLFILVSQIPTQMSCLIFSFNKCLLNEWK